MPYVLDKDKTVFLAYDNGIFTGAIKLRCDWNQYVFIVDIGVEEAYRRQGVGTLLMENAERWAKEKGMKGLALEAQDVNVFAARFYSKCGFEIGAVNTMLYRNLGIDEMAVFWYKRF